jgi:hypothetical protein
LRRRLHAYDLETHRIVPGILAPPIVCGSTASFDGGPETSRIFVGKEAAVREIRSLLNDPDVILAGANIAFDMGCLVNADTSLLPSIFLAYDEGRIHDVLIAQALDAVAHGHLGKHPSGGPLTDSKGRQTERYSLDICVRLALGRSDAKENDFWRQRYAILEQVPFALWPFEAVQYPKDDAWNTVEVAAVQLAYAELHEPYRNLSDLSAQCETAFALHLGAMWGVRSDSDRVATLEERATELHVDYVKRFKTYGFFKTDKKGKLVEDTAAVARAVAIAYGASEPCELCGKLGRVQKQHKVPCRGLKVKNRFQGCTAKSKRVVEGLEGVVAMEEPVLADHLVIDEASCEVCRGTGETMKPGNIVICPDCKGTGFDINPKGLPSLPRTEKGGVSSSRDTMSESGDEILIEFGKNKQEKILKTYLPFIKRGLNVPLTFKPNVLLESGRASYEDIIQTFPRWKLPPFADKRWVPSPRECFTSRRGRVFGSTDYAALELCTLSQVCLWVCKKSKMAEAINATKEPGDLHTALGAKLMNISFEEMKSRLKAKDKVAKDFRQASKPCYHPDTEILTRRGWKRIGDLSMEDEVASAIPKPNSMEVEIVWTKPLRITRRHSDELLRLHNEGIDLRVTPDHRMLAHQNRYTRKKVTGTDWNVVPASEFGKQRGWVNAGLCLGGEHVVDERLLRIAVAVQADGTHAPRWPTEEAPNIRLGFSKKRKIARLTSLLKPGEYSLSTTKNGAWERTTVFTLHSELTQAIKALLTDKKTIPWWWVELKSDLRAVVLDEVRHWDGTKMTNWRMHRFFSVIKSNHDVLQAMAAITNRKTRLSENDPRPNEQVCYELTIRNKHDSRGGNVAVESLDYHGDVVCLSVPSTFVVVRDGGVPVISGNCNFGLPGGMRAATLVLSSRKENNGSTKGPDGREYDGIRFCILVGGAKECGTRKVTEWQRQVIPPTCEMCLKLAEDQLIPAWFDQWPEMKEYFGYVKREIEITSGEIPCFGPWLFKPGARREPHRIRGGTPWRAAANNGFQALAADGAKYALRQVTREAYTDESSPLYQGRVRIPMFIHDELFSEGDADTAHLWAPRIAEVMVAAMREWVPDVWVAAETCLMTHWNKDAEPVYDASGKLVVWKPKAE